MKHDSKIQSIKALFARLWEALLLHERVRRERAMLASMPDEMLRDMGIHRADADLEAARKYTDIPEVRRSLSVSSTNQSEGRAQTGVLPTINQTVRHPDLQSGPRCLPDRLIA